MHPLLRPRSGSQSRAPAAPRWLANFHIRPIRSLALALLVAFWPAIAQAADNSAPVHNVNGSFVREWLVLGPINSKAPEVDFLEEAGGEANVRPKEGDGVTMKDGKRLTWTRLRSKMDKVNLEQAFGISEWSVAYAYCELTAGQDCDTNVRAHRVASFWLNGKKSPTIPGFEGRNVDINIDIRPSAPTKLNAGRNACLLKVSTSQAEEADFLFQPLPPGRVILDFHVANPSSENTTEASIQFYDKGEVVGRMKTDSSGNAQACLYPVAAEYDVRVTSGTLGTWLLNVALRPGERRKLDVTVKEAISISGQILALDLSPQSAMVVQALYAGPHAEVAQLGASPAGQRADGPFGLPGFSETTLTDTNGTFQFVNMRPGSYRLRSHGPDGYVHPEGGQGTNKTDPMAIAVAPGRTQGGVRFVFPEVKKGVWRTYPIVHGLNELELWQVHRTPDGLLWVGADQSFLYTYDGVEFRQMASTPEIPGHEFTALEDGADGTLWIGTTSGIAQYAEGQVKAFSFNDTLPRKAVNAILAEPDGTVWFATASGLSRYAGGKFVTFMTKDGLPGNTIYSLLRARDGLLWMTTGHGLAQFDGSSFKHWQPFDGFGEIPSLKALHQGRDGAIWFGTSHGAFRWDGNAYLRLGVENGLLSDNVRDIAETSDGMLWFATTKGLSKFNGTTVVNYTMKDGLSDPEVRGLFVDADDVVWCANGHGVSRFDPKRVITFGPRDGLAHYQGGGTAVMALAADPDGNYWVGTGHGPVMRTDGDKLRSVPSIPQQRYVRQIKRGAGGELWFGGDVGILRRGPTGLVPVLERKWVLGLCSDRDGNAWYGQGWNGGGVSRYNPATREEANFSKAQGLPDEQVWAVEEGADSEIWIGTGAGLARYRAGKIEDYRQQLGIPTGAVFNLRRDAEDTLWISSRQGLHRLKGTERISITATNGLPDPHVWCSARARDKIIWMGTESSGLVGYDGKAFTVLDKRDGFSGNSVFAVATNADDSLWVGCLDRGLTRYHPGKQRPSVRVRGVQLDDRAITNFSNLLEVETGRRITIEYREIDLKTHPDKRQFWYRLANHAGDTVFSAVTKDRRFEWTPRKGGAYSFEVQAIDRDLNYSAPARLAIRATVPWFMNAWILTPVGGTFGGLFVWAFIARALYVREREEAAGLSGQLLAQESQAREALEQKNRQLLEAKEAAETANQAKSTFLAHMSHEIRTPLNAVLGYAQILQQDKTLGDEQHQAVATIERSGHHLLTLINEILDLSKIESGRMELSESDFDLAVLILEISVMFEPRCQQKGLDWRVEWDGQAGFRSSQSRSESTTDGILVHGDAGKLRQVLINLVGNAVKFTDSGRVTLSIKSKAGSTEDPPPGSTPAAQLSTFTFEVKDTGPGLPADIGEKIFEPFTQGLEGKQKGGTGLGLAIARRQIELMGGDLHVESELGKGARFFFSLPLAAAVAPSPEMASSRAKRLPAGTRVQALVLDDVAENRDVLSRLLQGVGVKVAVAEGGEQAVAALRSHPYDIAFLDIHMPGMNGLDVVERMLKDSRTGGAKLVAVSASVLSHEQKLYEAKGFDAFVGKPFRFEQICECLERLLGVTFEFEAVASNADEKLGPGRGDVPVRPIGAGAAEGSTAGAEFDPGLAGRHPLRILVADDYDMNQKLVARILQGFAYRCEFAGNGVEVIQALERQRFDLVFLDVQMPRMDGYETAREIRRRWGGSERPRLVAMTASALRGDREKCLDAGMDDFVAKPVQLAEIRRVLEQAGIRRSQPKDAPITEEPRRGEDDSSLANAARMNMDGSSAKDSTTSIHEPTLSENSINWTRLNLMFGDDRATVRAFLEEYLQKTAEQIEQLRVAINLANAAEVELLAHRCKGASANFGIEAMVNPMAQLEDAARSGDWANGSRWMAEAQAAFALVEKVLRSRI